MTKGTTSGTSLTRAQRRELGQSAFSSWQPAELVERARRVAKARGVSVTALVAEWLESLEEKAAPKKK